MRGKLSDRQATTSTSIFRSQKLARSAYKSSNCSGVTSTMSRRRATSPNFYSDHQNSPFFFLFFASSAWTTPFTPFGHRLRRLHSICQVIFHRRLYLTGRAFTWTTIFQRCNTHHVHSVWTLVRREGYHQLERSSDVKWKNHRAILTAKTRVSCIESSSMLLQFVYSNMTLEDSCLQCNSNNWLSSSWCRFVRVELSFILSIYAMY